MEAQQLISATWALVGATWVLAIATVITGVIAMKSTNASLKQLTERLASTIEQAGRDAGPPMIP